MHVHQVLCRAQVAQAFPEGTLQREVHDDFKKVLRPRVPIIYATKGFKADSEHLYVFIDPDDLSSPTAFGPLPLITQMDG